MSALDDKIETIQTLLNSLTWRKLALLTTFLAVVGFSYSLFDNRYAVYEFFSKARSIPPATTIKVSESTKYDIGEFVNSSEIVVAVQVILIDFERNSRTSIYTKIGDPVLEDIYKKSVLESPPDMPLFNNDLANNESLVNLVNGNFICTPYKEIHTSKLVPDSALIINTVCSGPVPPFYGRFSGIINIYLAREPKSIEIEQIKTVARRLGLSIYNNDFR